MRNIVRARRPLLATAAILAALGAAAAGPLSDAIAPKPASPAPNVKQPAPTEAPNSLPWHSSGPAAPAVPAPQRSSPWGGDAPPAPPPASTPAPAPTIAQPAPPVAAVPAPAQASAPTVTRSATGVLVENLILGFGPITYRMPRVELRGTTMSGAEVASLLDPASAEPILARMQRLAASEIAIPEVTAETAGPGRQVTTYRDVILTGVKGGRIDAANAGGSVFEVAAPTGMSRGTFAHLSLSDIDLALVVSLYDGSARESASKRIYGGFSFDGIALTDANGGSTRIARIASGEVFARPVAGGLGQLVQALSTAPPDLSKAEPAERARIFGLLADLVGSTDLRSLEATGFEFKDGKTSSDTGRIARIAYSGGAEGRAAEIRIDALDVASEGGHVRIGSIAVGGVSLAPFLEAARTLPGADDPAQMRKLVPASGTLRITDLTFEQVERQAETGPARFAIGTIELSAAKPVENLPSELRLGLRDLQFPVDAKREQEGLKTLAELGYTQVQGSLAAAAGWNEPSREVMLRDIAVRAPEMGSITISGVLGNVGREVFDPDTTVATIALASATATALDITVENAGLFERVLSRQARQQNRSVDDLRREYGIAAAIGIPAMLGNSVAAKTIGTAVARFVAKPGRLSIQARTKNPAGLGLADLTGASQPAELLNLVDVTAGVQ